LAEITIGSMEEGVIFHDLIFFKKDRSDWLYSKTTARRTYCKYL